MGSKKLPWKTKEKNVKAAGFEPPRFGTFQNGNFHRTENVGFFGGKPDLSGESRNFRRRSHTFRVKAGRFVGKKPGSSGKKLDSRIAHHVSFVIVRFSRGSLGRDGTGRDGIR